MDNLVCTCGITFKRSDAFHIYNKMFCSLACLRIYKLEYETEEVKRHITNNVYQSNSSYYSDGGSAF